MGNYGRNRRALLGILLAAAVIAGCKPALRITPAGGFLAAKGSAVDGVGDVNGDQWPDFIVAAANAGSVRVHSGAPSTFGALVIHDFDLGDGQGLGVAGIGDVDGDITADLAIGDPDGVGVVQVRSGSTGALVRQIISESSTDSFGSCIASSNDLDGDAVPDFMAGAHRYDGLAGSDAGKLYVYSGATGSVVSTFEGEAAGDALGTACSGAPDLDGDAVPDVLVSATAHDGPGGADAGRVYALSGASGAVLYTLDGASAGAAFGRALSGAGDVDGDALGDFVVGEVGRATVFSGATGAPIFSLAGGPSFGFSAAHAGDVNGDSVPDFIVGEPDEGIARVYSGVGGAFLEDLFFLDRTGSGGAFGFAVAGAGDVNGDGRDDVVVGAPEYTGGGGQSFGGAAFVFTVPASLF